MFEFILRYMMLSSANNGKACGPSEVCAELLTALGEYGIYWLHHEGLMEQARGSRWHGERATWYHYTTNKEMLWSAE